MRRSRRYQGAATLVPPETALGIDEALEKLKTGATAKFDETAEATLVLGIRPSQVVVRGTVNLPHGTGKAVRVLAFAKGDSVTEAEQAGADLVGADEYIEKIKEGWLEFDTVIATPDMMKDVGRLGKILGPRGLMPNPKTGTVTNDIAKAVSESKAGKIEYRTDKTANVHAPVGKASFEADNLMDNLREIAREIVRARPAAAKGNYIRNVTICTTMGPGVDVDISSLVDSTRS